MPANLLLPSQIAVPVSGRISVFINKDDGFYYYKTPDGRVVFMQAGQNGIFNIYENFVINKIENLTGDEVEILKTNSPTVTIKFCCTRPQIIAAAGGGGRGKPGVPGPPGPNTVNVQNQGVPIGAKSTFNFIGSGVTATNVGGGKVNIDIPGECIIDVTYAELVLLISENGLSVGCNYRITDFRTRERIPNTAEIILGPTEPLIVQAVRTDAIDEATVLSTVFTKDILSYEVINSTTSADDRGRIYYREDTTLDVFAGYDWRVVKFRRWESVLEPGKFIVLTDNGEDFQDFYTFNNSSSAENCNATHIGKITDSIIPFALSMGVDISDKLNNFIIGSLAPDVFTVDNNFADDCFYNTIICLGDGVILSNRAAALFAGFPPSLGEFTGNSYYDGKTFLDNIFNTFYVNNRMKQDFNSNEFNVFSIENIFETGYNANKTGNNFQNNIIDELCNGNIFGNQCSVNVIGKRFGFDISGIPKGNVVGDNFSGNTIGDRCFSNNIGNDFSGNTLGNDNINNVILHDFANNKTSDNFQLNTIESGLNGKDFTVGATRVYQNYTKEIVKTTGAPVPDYVLRYTDSTPPFGALVYDDIFS